MFCTGVHMCDLNRHETYRAYQRKMAIRSRGKSRGKSRQIAAKFGKFRFKKNGDHFFKKSRPIASQRAFQKTMAITLEVKFDPYLACTILVHAGQFFFSI